MQRLHSRLHPRLRASTNWPARPLIPNATLPVGHAKGLWLALGWRTPVPATALHELLLPVGIPEHRNFKGFTKNSCAPKFVSTTAESRSYPTASASGGHLSSKGSPFVPPISSALRASCETENTLCHQSICAIAQIGPIEKTNGSSPTLPNRPTSTSESWHFISLKALPPVPPASSLHVSLGPLSHHGSEDRPLQVSGSAICVIFTTES